MTDRTDGDGLRLVPIEPTPDMRIAGGTAWSEALKDAGTYVDCADACYKAMIRTVPQAPDTGEGTEPVAWRWRPWGSANWIYDPTPEWREANKTEAEFQPLYAALPKPAPDHADDFGDMPSAYLAARSSLAKPAPDALQRVLCGIVGTPDANGMVTFKVHESVVRQMQAAGEPAPDALREAMVDEKKVILDFFENAENADLADETWSLNATNARKSLNTILEAALSAPVQSGAATSPAKPDRETLIHTICPHIRQYSDSHWQGNHACLQCPATVKTPQGDAVQRCRRDAERAADDVIRCWQSTGDQQAPQVSGASTPAVVLQERSTPNKGD